MHITRKSGRKPRSPSVGAILRLKLQCFRTEKRQVVLYETVVLVLQENGKGRLGFLNTTSEYIELSI